ncbi:MAG: molybdenum cofactor biosynthesis protein MoaB [Candidatus Tectomicrobia bacterium]|nr:molybdenum cofactor biosynthesis protein MoaB [Candidatus Tectomicrobia bacterium]
MAHEEHKQAAQRSLSCAVITVSDTRTEETDTSGRLILDLLKEEKHNIAEYTIIRDEQHAIRAAIKSLLEREGVQAIVLNGGTGISPRDVTCEVVESFLEKRLDGFGEIFRYLSFQEIGSAAIMSRAVAGTVGGKILISLPGSTGAVRLAMTKLVLPELGHMVSQVNRR